MSKNIESPPEGSNSQTFGIVGVTETIVGVYVISGTAAHLEPKVRGRFSWARWCHRPCYCFSFSLSHVLKPFSLDGFLRTLYSQAAPLKEIPSVI